MYRPKDWENPYENHGAVLKEMGNEIAFEAGADAMLEGLGENMVLSEIYDKDWYADRTGGKWVFIPDEE